MNNSYYNVSHSRDYYKGKSVEFAGEWTSGVRYFNDEYLNSLVVYTEKDATGNIIHSALLACKKTHIAAYNNSIPDSTNNQPHLVINDDLGVIGIEPNDYWIFVSGSLMGTPGKSAEVVNTYLEAVALATENNISKIVFVKEEKSIYFIVGAGELRKMISISDFSELFESKVDKEPGKGLSTNDYSNSEKEKLEGIEENAQRNVIEEVDLNGVKIEPVNKVVSINVDTEVTENSNNLVTSGAVHKKLDLKQDQLIPGDNITIQDNVISATNNVDLSDYAKTEDVDKKLDTKQDTLIAGNGIKIENNKIDTTSITESETQPDTSIWVNPTENTEVELTYNRSQIDTLVGLKQDKLIAGNGIQIVDSTISSTVDTNPFIVVSQLPSVGETGKIYLTPAEKPENNNLADEWIWNNNSWERLGSASIDLSNYPKLVDLTDIINNEADNYITEARFNELKELLSSQNTIFYFNKDGMYYYNTSIDLSKISDTPAGYDYEAIENIVIYFPKKQDDSGVYGYKLVLFSGFNAASYDFYWSINLISSNFSVRIYNGSTQGLVPAPTYGSTKKYLNVNGQWTAVKSSELDNDSGFITASDISVKVDKEEGKGLSSNDYTNEEKAKLASLENYNDTEIKELINKKVNDADLAKVAKTGKYSDLIDEPLIKSSQAPTNNEPLWVNPDEDQEEVEVYNRSQVDALLNTKQNTLIPGNGIIIDGNVISSTGGGESGGSVDLSPYAKKTDVETALAGKQDVISDLADIKEGANKGKTALQSYNETDPVYTADKPNIATKAELNTKQNTISDLDVIRNGASKGATALQPIQSITYAELVALRDSSSLVAGMQYRITDYTCTTTTAGTKSAGHVFDIIVTADSESVLNEEARVIQHEGDTYFANCDLNAWKLWYSLDNDTEKFAWADGTNGKGVIYRMIDEFNNDVPYDFKNIQFYRKWDSSKSLWSTISSDNNGISCYTFSSEGDKSTTSFTDMSLNSSNNIHSNVIKEYINSCKQTLNNNCFFGDYFHYNSLGNGCYNNSFGSNCANNSFGDYCYNNSFRGSCSGNSFGSNCFYNSLGNNCPYNSFGNNCCSNSLKEGCYRNSFGNSCNNNSFGSGCTNNSFRNNCQNNSFERDCSSNSFGNECNNNSFRNYCLYNSFGNNCCSNSFKRGYHYNSFGNSCHFNSFEDYCQNNSFGNSCNNNSFGGYCQNNSFGSGCTNNSFRIIASETSTLKNYVQYNHFDDGCSYNVIWNDNTTGSTILLKNININRGVVGTSNSCNMINIDVLNSEQEINVNQVNENILISNISDITNKLDKTIEINYVDLVTLRDNAQLIPGQKYRIIDYITKTSQENTKSAGHQFDIIVTALDESTLSEEAQAIQHSNDEYFGSSNLSAWKIWYCLDNDTNRFAWAGDEKVGEIEHKSYDSSKCTINPELIQDKKFITPFNFESCVWVDGDNDGNIPYDTPHHDIDELIYEWGYFTDENGVNQLCIYKSDADLYAEEGQPDYGDKYLYRGVVNVDGTEYDYWQKWDQQSEDIDVNFSGDYVYATTQRIVSNPEAYSVTIKTEGIYKPGKGVIYRMIDEWNNDVPYDFKNIMFKRDWSEIAPDSGLSGTIYCYTFSVFLNGFSDGATVDDESIKAKECIESDGDGHFGNNVIGIYQNLGVYSLNDIVFVTDWTEYSVNHFSNIFESNCRLNTFRNDSYSNSFGNGCYSNSFGNYCYSNTFGNDSYFNSFGNYCYSNTFWNECIKNTFGDYCFYNIFENNYYSNSFGNFCCFNTFGNYCSFNFFGNNCRVNSFENDCNYIKFASTSSATTKYNYYRQNHFGDGCKYILLKGAETASDSAQVQNYNFAQGLQGTSSAYLTIDGVRSRDYETKVAKNSAGELKIYCEADLIA